MRWYGQTRLAAYSMGAWHKDGFKGSVLLRQEWAEDQAAPFTGSLGAEWAPGRVGEFTAHVSRNFNLPTLNDRFWRNLGNADLRPEKGYSADLGWQWESGEVTTGINAFHLILDDWILWQPDASGLFRPGNLRKVWSRGMEGVLKWTHQWQGLKGAYSGRIQWSATTLEAVYHGSEGILGGQLAYTARFSSSQNFRLTYKETSVAYLHQITGKRPDVVGNTLPGFSLGTLFISQRLFRSRFQADFRLENIWNTSYEVFRFRPMPGRSWSIGMAYRWK
jgi:iron complex outermembrane receptor protein